MSSEYVTSSLKPIGRISAVVSGIMIGSLEKLLSSKASASFTSASALPLPATLYDNLGSQSCLPRGAASPKRKFAHAKPVLTLTSVG